MVVILFTLHYLPTINLTDFKITTESKTKLCAEEKLTNSNKVAYVYGVEHIGDRYEDFCHKDNDKN